MSVWYDVDVTAYGYEEDLAKLLAIKTEDIEALNEVTLSFGQKNRPGVDLGDLAKKHPNLVFLVHMTVECHSGSTFLFKYDKESDNDQYIPLERFDYNEQEYNIRLLKEFPELDQELTKNKSIRWKYFCWNKLRLFSLMSKHESYQETAFLVSQEDIDFDNAELIDD
jgi:hypothetical protein